MIFKQYINRLLGKVNAYLDGIEIGETPTRTSETTYRSQRLEDVKKGEKA